MPDRAEIGNLENDALLNVQVIVCAFLSIPFIIECTVQKCLAQIQDSDESYLFS